jgi:DNA-binding transcriptional regulator/RsmH inhibitor MraZ
LKSFASIKDEIAFIGQGYFFQIVNPKTASELRQKSRDRLNLNKKTLSRILSGKDE